MEIKKIWKVVFDPDEAYVRQLQDLTMLYRTTRDKDRPDAIEATAPGLGNCLDDYLRDQGLPVCPRVIDITDPETMDAHLGSNKVQEVLLNLISTNAGKTRRVL